MSIDFAADMEANAPAINNEQLQMIADLADQQRTLEERITKGEVYLAQLKESLREISDKRLPNAMAEVGMSEFKLADGTKITIKDEVYCSIPKENPGPAFAWLRENNFDSLIKNEIMVSFGKGQDEDAIKVAHLIADAGFRPEQKQTVHPMTLKAFIKEQMGKGTDVPLEAFGAYAVARAKVALPKGK